MAEREIGEERLLTASAEDAGTRADVFLSGALEISRAGAQKLLSGSLVSQILPGGRSQPLSKNAKLKEGDVLLCQIPLAVPSEVRPEAIPLDVRYEDGDVIVVNKPKGMVVHPAPGHENGTLVSALLYHCGDSLSGIGGVNRPGIVHRIDRDTTGLLIAAKNDAAHGALAAQLADHSMYRVYRALILGNLPEDTGTVHAPIGRHPVDRKRMAVLKGDKSTRDAVTHYTVLERFPGFSYVELRLETGRTHQIRVHMSYLGHPLLGDTVYGGGHTPFEKKHAALMEGQCLHAGRLVFAHPSTGESVEVTAPLPSEFEKLLSILRSL